MQAGKSRHVIALNRAKKDKGRDYWISNWSFRRAQSKISSDRWIDKGKGNKVKF